MELKVVKITPKTKEPITEVLAIGYQDEIIVGWLRQDDAGDWSCENDCEGLDEVYAFITSKELVKAIKKTLRKPDN